MTALSCGLCLSMRVMASSTSSAGVTPPLRTNSASPSPSYAAYSAKDIGRSPFSFQLSAVSYQQEPSETDS